MDAVKVAIDAGYRHFDTAWAYNNESDVGRAVRAKIDEGVINRQDAFVVTKVSAREFRNGCNKLINNVHRFSCGCCSCGAHSMSRNAFNMHAVNRWKTLA